MRPAIHPVSAGLPCGIGCVLTCWSPPESPIPRPPLLLVFLQARAPAPGDSVSSLHSGRSPPPTTVPHVPLCGVQAAPSIPLGGRGTCFWPPQHSALLINVCRMNGRVNEGGIFKRWPRGRRVRLRMALMSGRREFPSFGERAPFHRGLGLSPFCAGRSRVLLRLLHRMYRQPRRTVELPETGPRSRGRKPLPRWWPEERLRQLQPRTKSQTDGADSEGQRFASSETVASTWRCPQRRDPRPSRRALRGRGRVLVGRRRS